MIDIYYIAGLLFINLSQHGLFLLNPLLLIILIVFYSLGPVTQLAVDAENWWFSDVQETGGLYLWATLGG